MTTLADRGENAPEQWCKFVYHDPDPESSKARFHHVTGSALPFVVAIAYGETQEEAHANGRLVAAAPEMKELIQLLSWEVGEEARIEIRKLLARIDGDEDGEAVAL